VLFIILGAICFTASKNVVEVESPTYDSPQNATAIPPEVIPMVSFPALPEDMPQPVYFYYKLTNFYQNHRRYVKSRSDDQLRGEVGSTSNCDPLEKNDQGQVFYPCGLIANSMFNDTFELFLGDPTTGTPLRGSYDNMGISWESDRNDKFKTLTHPTPSETNIGYRGQRLPNVQDEDFIVWMRTAGLPTFKKLKLIIRRDLKKGDVITARITNTFEVKSFSGTKAMVLSTANWLGGKNDFLGIAYLVVGAICLLLAAGFALKHHFSPRPLGDMKYFNWPGIGRASQPAGR